MPVAAILEFLKSRIGQIILALVIGFGSGWTIKGRLDDGEEARAALATSKATIVELERQATATKAIAEQAAARERETASLASDLQRKVDDYADELSRTPIGDCAFNDADLERLRGIITRPIGSAAPGSAR